MIGLFFYLILFLCESSNNSLMRNPIVCLCTTSVIPKYYTTEKEEIKIYLNFAEKKISRITFEGITYLFEPELIFYTAYKSQYIMHIDETEYTIEGEYYKYHQHDMFTYILSNIDSGKQNSGLKSHEQKNHISLVSQRGRDSDADPSTTNNPEIEHRESQTTLSNDTTISDNFLCSTCNPKSKPTIVGHRGNGMNKHHEGILYRENTIAAFEHAQEQGVEWVEFDVQVTQDLIPVIYHDFGIVHNNSMALLAHLNNEDFYQLQNFDQKNNVYNFDVTKLQNCTLEDVYNSCTDLNFNIEVKYLSEKDRKEHGIKEYMAVDKYCLHIWDVVKKYTNNGNKIIFSSFDADVCKYFKLIQDVYDVFYLSDGCDQNVEATKIEGKQHDSCTESNSGDTTKTNASLACLKCNEVCKNIDAKTRALHFCIKYGLEGVVLDSKSMVGDYKAFIDAAHQKGKKVFLYGDETNEEKYVDGFIDANIDGLICDKVKDVLQWSQKLVNK